MSPDYKKTQKSLDEFNTKVKELDLEKYFYIFDKNGKKYNLLATFQHSIFSDYKNTPNPSLFKRGVRQRFQAFIMQLTLLCISFFSLLYYIFSRKEKLILYSIDKISDKKYLRDARVSFLYEYIDKQNISTLEIIHTVPNLETLKNFWKRKSPVIYFESIQFFAGLFSFNFVKIKNQNYLINKYLNRAKRIKFTTKVWKFIFEVTNSKNLWGLDDVRYLAESILPVQELGNQVTIFQHGHYTKYHPGFLKGIFNKDEIIKANKIVVWNNYWKQELLRLGTYFNESEIVVGGEKEVKVLINNSNFKNINTILIPFETDAPKEEVKKYIEKFLQDGKIVYFKLRKDWPKDRQLIEYGLNKNIHENFITIFNEDEIVKRNLPEIDCVAGVYSTYLYDVLYLGKPVLLLDTSMDYGEGMVFNGLAIKFGLNSSFEEVLKGWYNINIFNIQKYYSNQKLMSDFLNATYATNIQNK